MQINRLKVFNVDIAYFIFLHRPHFRHDMLQSVVVLRVINHFTGQVFALLNSIATYIDRYDYERLADFGQVAVACKKPANSHVCIASPAKLTCSEALTILKNSGDLIVSDNFLHQGAIDKAALHRLSLLTTTAYVTSAAQDLLHNQDLGDVIVVAESKATRDTLGLIHVDHDEKVDKCFV